MKTKIIFLLFLTFPGYYSFAWNSEYRARGVIDSLKKLLAATRQDTTKIALRYFIGAKEPVRRIGYWDSLAADAHKNNLPAYECQALGMEGSACNVEKEFARSVECLNRGLLIAEKAGLDADKLPLYKYLATAYYELSDIGKALDVNYKGLMVAEALKDKKYIVTFKSAKGAYYCSLGSPEKALKIHLECLNIYREMKDDLYIAGTLLDIGNDYSCLKDNAKAAAYYFESKKYAGAFGTSPYTVEILNSVAAAYEMSNMPDSAEPYYTKAYQMSLDLHSKQCIASSLALLASHNYNIGNNKTAIKQATEAIELAKSIKFTRQIPGLLLNLKNLYQKEGRYNEALQAYEMYYTMKDSMASEQTRNQASEKEFAHTFEQKEHENKLLAQQNQIQTLQLKKNKFLMFGMGGTVLLAMILFYLFLLQNKLSAQHQRIQLEQKLLRSQMNPHFIYNSLQAIQNYVLNHDARDAVKYLSSFATLTRNVLENSRMDYIPLKKEISLLENYLQLQKLRFGSRFDYAIHVDDKIDPEQMTIPPMLAQPFIENAIKHGMHDIETGGKIDVAYSIGDNALLMEITDNGHGMKHTDTKGKEHRSLAMEITQERVILMNKKKRRKTTCTISDAYPQRSDRNGVKVSFMLPLYPIT